MTAVLDTGYACEFMNDGKVGQCDKVATWKFKTGAALCDFHAGFIRSVDYFNEHGKPRKLTGKETHHESIRPDGRLREGR